MSKFRTDFEMSIDVEFLNPEKAKAFFIDGDWKKSFYTFNDLADLARGLSCEFHDEPKEWENNHYSKDIEGFGLFIEKNEKWYSIEDAKEVHGGIVIHYQDALEVCDFRELDEVES